jgi:hypothetical protein
MNDVGEQATSTSIQYGPQPHVAGSESPVMVIPVGEVVATTLIMGSA